MQSDLHEARKRPKALALEPNLTLKFPEERGMTKPVCASHLLPTPSSEMGQAPQRGLQWGTEKRSLLWGLVFAFSTVQYLRAEGWLLVQLTSHAGVSSWLAGALYLLQAGRGEKKKYPLLVVQIKPSLCLFLIKQLAPRHETEEFYCWVVWKLYMGYSWGKANAWCWVSPFPKAKCISPWVRRARPAGTKSFTPALTAKRQQWIMFINQPHSSSGGAAEGKQGSGSRMPFPSPRAQTGCGFMSTTGIVARATSTARGG